MVKEAMLLNGGLGTRIYPLGRYIPKCLIPVYDTPLMMYHINILESVGVNKFLMVINRVFEVIIKRALENGYTGNSHIEFIIQEESNGCGEATLLGLDHLDQKFFLILGDEYYESDVFFRQAAMNTKYDHIIGLTHYDSVKQITSGCHVLTEGDEVIELYEKPKIHQISSGICWNGAAVTTPEIFEELLKLKQLGKADPLRGVVLVDALIRLMENGQKIGGIYDPGININVTGIEDYICATEIERRKRLRMAEYNSAVG
jgi:dTDP-glucose pyrophosphorylase